MPSDGQDSIILEGVSTNNLKGINVSFPQGKLSVVTGVSGSGKSSLVFDTLYGEAYRRYVESLSSFARQYLKALPKPVIERVENLPPAIAVKQSRSGANSRSTVGTMTEIADLLRIVFANASEIICPKCDLKVEADTSETIAKKVLECFSGEQVLVLAPLTAWEGVAAKALKAQLEQQGFSRAFVEGELVKVQEVSAKKLKEGFVVVDRIRVDEAQFRRVAESAELGLKVGRQQVLVKGGGAPLKFVSDLSCGGCGKVYTKPSIALFSFNHPFGACPHCQGFGMEGTIDWDKVTPDLDSSLADEGVIPWNFGQAVRVYNAAKASAKTRRLSIHKTFAEYSPAEWKWLREGDGKSFSGVLGFFKWLESKRHKAHYRIHIARFRKYVTCSVCEGARLRPEALACRVGPLNISQVNEKSLQALAAWVKNLEDLVVGGGRDDGLAEALSELSTRTNYLLKVGLSYLTSSRQTRTLSGGEQQRINMARCLGSALTDTLYCLDEPTAGLHARDSQRLLEVLEELRDQGNTVVVVEHEQGVIDGADYLVEIGPEAGHRGGDVVFANDPATLGRVEAVRWDFANKQNFRHWIQLKGASTHNLKDVDVRFPVGGFTAVCGVSGSGKTSLIQHTLYPLLAKHFGSDPEGQVEDPVAKSIGPKAALAAHQQVVHVSQSTLGRSSRSNIATYLGIYEEIRKMLADTAKAKKLRLKPGHFSFNTKGGRCEHCRGLGTVVEDLSFLGDMEIVCPVCEGKRFDAAVLSVEHRDKNLSDILQMTVAEAKEHFFDRTALVRVLNSVLDMGLGYVTLGQNTSSFSGGEAQRLKLLRLLKTAGRGQASILIFDEPTTGLSDRDVENLLRQFRRLKELGHTVVVVEHHVGILRSCDWLVEIGPEAAEAGGQLVYQGPPRELRGVAASRTEVFLHKNEH